MFSMHSNFQRLVRSDTPHYFTDAPIVNIFSLSIYGTRKEYFYLTASPGNITGLPPLVTPQQFLEVMLGLVSQTGLPVDVSQIPNNLTALVAQLRELSQSLEINGNIWTTVDQLGNATEMIYKYVLIVCCHCVLKSQL